MDKDPHTRLRCLRRVVVVRGPRTAVAGMALAVAAACASTPARPTSGAGSGSGSASGFTSQSAASQPGADLVARLLDTQSAPSGYQVLPASAFAVPTGSAPGTPACTSAALGNPYTALTTVRPVEVAERGIDGPADSSGFFWRGTEQLFGYQGDGAQKALTAVRQWVTRCTGIQPGGTTVDASIGAGPKLGDESLTLHVSMNVRISSGEAAAPFDSIIVRTGTVVFVVCEQGMPAANGSGDNSARLTAVANAAYARFQHF
jgi:hypothetical protein